MLCQDIAYAEPDDGQSICTPSSRALVQRRIWRAHEMHLSLLPLVNFPWNSQWIPHHAICYWSSVHVHQSWPIHVLHRYSHRLLLESCSQYHSICSYRYADAEYVSLVVNTNFDLSISHRPYDVQSHMVLDMSRALELDVSLVLRPIHFDSQFSDILMWVQRGFQFAKFFNDKINRILWVRLPSQFVMAAIATTTMITAFRISRWLKVIFKEHKIETENRKIEIITKW